MSKICVARGGGCWRGSLRSTGESPSRDNLGKQTGLTTKGNGDTMSTLAALITRNTFSGIAAGEIAFDGMSDDLSEIAIVFSVYALIVGLKDVEMIVGNSEKGASIESSWFVNGLH